MRIHLRVESENKEHVRSTLFIDGRNCGALCMSPTEFSSFYQFLGVGMNEMGEPEDTFELTEPEETN